jgi:peptidoglycan/LPS O-acetylase OafA/YrhL
VSRRATPPRFHEIECLRGVAIALVVVHHLHGYLYGGKPPPLAMLPWPLAAIVLTGYTGVDLFFVLSGFLLSRPFLAEARGGPAVGRAAYAMRRVLRVMPLYVVAVVVASIAVAQRPLDVLDGIPYLVFLNAFPGGARRLHPHSDPWWSLATEAQFYLLLPFLPLVLRGARGRLVGATLLAAYAAVYAALSLHWLRPTTLGGVLALAQSLVGRAPLFLTGIAAAALYDRFADGVRDWAARRPIGARLAGDTTLLAALGGLLVLLSWVAQEDYVTREARWPLWHVTEGVLWAAVLLALLLLPATLRPLLANRGWGFIGLISYSLYLVHAPVIVYGRRLLLRVWPATFPWMPGASEWTGRGVVGATLLAAVAVGLATLTYVVIERPALRLKSRVPT